MKRMALVLSAALLLTAAGALADEQQSFTLDELTQGHGSLVSVSEKAVTEKQLAAIYEAAAKVTVGNAKTWQLTVIPDLDLMQELLPVYNDKGLVKEGCVAIIVSCSSDEGDSHQYHKADMTDYVAAGMVAQQICIAAQMQGLGFKVITDSIYESGYTMYKNNEPGEENILHEATEWEDWVREFAIPKENYYLMDPEGGAITVMGGKTVALKSGKRALYESDGTAAQKQKISFVQGYMTPCAIVLIGNTDDAVKPSGLDAQSLYTVWDGSFDPYPESYGGSTANLRHD